MSESYPPVFRLQRYNADAYRVLRGGDLAGLLLRHANDTWVFYDQNESRRMNPMNYPDRKAALADAERVFGRT